MCCLSQIAGESARVRLCSQEQAGASARLPRRHPWCLLLFGGVLHNGLRNEVKLLHGPEMLDFKNYKRVQWIQCKHLLFLVVWIFMILSISQTLAAAWSQRCQFAVIHESCLCTIICLYCCSGKKHSLPAFFFQNDSSLQSVLHAPCTDCQ